MVAGARPLPMEQQITPPISISILSPPTSDSPTLLVKHLPDALPLDTLKRLFSHYGASDIRPCVAAKMKNCAFVEFKEEAQAARAQSQLHRLRFLGKILAVEKAKPYSPQTLPQDQTEWLPQVRPMEGKPMPSSLGHPERGLPASGRRAEPIASSLGVDYPFPPHLEYAYPPADGNILTNIVNALIAVPRFYTQVLHLMNKMNLPAPFRPALPTPRLAPPLPPPPPEPSSLPHLDRDLSSDESELESSEEMASAAAEDAGGEVGGRDKGRQEKRKRKDVVETTSEARTTFLVPTEKPLIKKRRPVLQINISSKGKAKDSQLSKGVEVPEGHVCSLVTEEAEHTKEETRETKSSATREELMAGKMPSNELFALPMFKNYTRGMPTPVLYIKNLSKDVTQDDLLFIFGVVFPTPQHAQSQLGVRLMQEGRMRGQAFVTFPSTELAEDALNVVHGYMLKGKPMVAQFGRNPEAAAKK